MDTAIYDIYLDANATSPVLPAALAAANQALGATFGNPSSSHSAGLRARARLDATRARARRAIGAGDGQLTFTSGATEGIHTAVLSALCALRERRAAGLPCGDLLLYGATEHKAVPESLAHWNRLLGTGCELRALPVDGDGRHRLDLLRQLAPRAALVCTMAANNETGVVSDLAGIEAVLDEVHDETKDQRGSRALWLVDCVQALGKLALDLAATKIDYAPFSGHKLYAPKGIGMLYVRAGAPYTPLMTGGGQEAGQRAGTENMAGIAALGAVLAALEEGATFRTPAQMSAYRERLADALRCAFPGVVFNAPFGHALPTTLNFSVPGVASGELLNLFDAAALHVSAGSACSAAQAAPSHVLAAMGLPEWRAASAVRLSFGALADDALIDAACSRIARCGAALRSATAAQAAPVEAGPSTSFPRRREPHFSNEALASQWTQWPCASELGSRLRGNDGLGQAVLPNLAAAGCTPRADRELDRPALERLLERHPDALLVDVREAAEHAACVKPFGARATLNVPLSRLEHHVAIWLREPSPRPLVFFCRSGNRSARAAHHLHQLGYTQAWHLAGGLALA